MRLAVDSGCYADASTLLCDADHGVTAAVQALVGVLDGCHAMSGTDEGGRTWARAYDQVAGELVRAGADLGAALGTTGELLAVCGAHHERAEASARLLPSPVGGEAPTESGRAGAERLTPAPLPSAYGGVGGEPSGWHWVAGHLQGLLWPDADTGAMRSAGTAWLAAADRLDAWSRPATSASYLMEGQVSPEVPTAVSTTRELGRHAVDLSAACHDVGRACVEYADHVDQHHAELTGICRELLGWTAVDQATGAVLSFVTAGGAEAAAQVVEAGVLGRAVARVVSVLRRLVELARAAAELLTRGLARVGEILARLRSFTSLRATRGLERVGVSVVGRRVLARLPDEVQGQVEQAIERAETGRVRFDLHDGKEFENRDPTLRLPPGQYRMWTAAAPDARRGLYRVIVEGDPRAPRAIYVWDHTTPPVRIGP